MEGGDNTRVIDKAYMDIQLEHLKDNQEGISTGFVDLDYQWGGLKRGHTYLVAARPAMGKTAFALNMVSNIAIKGNHRIAYYSLGQSTEGLIKRLISMESGERLDRSAVRNMNPWIWKKIAEASRQIGNGNLVVNDTCGIYVETLERELSESVMSGVEVVIIDYLQLLNSDQEMTSRLKETEYLCRFLKSVAKKYDVAVIVLSQISRRVEERKDRRPVIGDLDSCQVANCFANVSFIYRDEYYKLDTEDKNVAEIITARNIFGNPGVVKLAWNPEQQRFYNLDKLYREEADEQYDACHRGM